MLAGEGLASPAHEKVRRRLPPDLCSASSCSASGVFCYCFSDAQGSKIAGQSDRLMVPKAPTFLCLLLCACKTSASLLSALYACSGVPRLCCGMNMGPGTAAAAAPHVNATGGIRGRRSLFSACCRQCWACLCAEL